MLIKGYQFTIEDTVDPGVNDDRDHDGSLGAQWFNTTNGKVFVCVDDTVGAAIWTELKLSTTTTV